jgi:hypothetical protein
VRRTRRSRGRTTGRVAGLVAAALLAALIIAPAAWGQTPYTDIHSAGRLSDIYIGNDLGCQVREGGFSSTEFFPNAVGPGDCGTFMETGSDSFQAELLGPDFANHPGSTHTSFPNGEIPFTPVSQSFTGSGTSASPYQVTTVVQATDPPDQTGPSAVLQFTEVDTYVVGNDFYRTDVTVSNIGPVDMDAQATLYHAADCQLRGSTNGFGIAEPPLGATVVGVSCSLSTTSDAVREELVPISPSGGSFTELPAATMWQDLGGTVPSGCNTTCSNNVDNGTAIWWTFGGLAQGASQTFSFNTVIADTAPAGGFSFIASSGTSIGGIVATITDPNPNAAANAYSATINWGDGASTPGTIAEGNGSFTVNGNHSYAAGGSYPIAVTITSVGTSQGSSTVTDSATITATPTSVLTGAPSVTAAGAGFSGSANPDGLPTTAVFQYGLDPKYSGGGPVVYTNSTAAQSVGSDFASHQVSASVSGLVPNALYHVRLVATNSAGTTFGPDVTFTTAKLPAPGSPTLGKSFNISLVSGLVLVKVNGHFIPLTELTQIPKNTVINALHGTLSLTTAALGPSGAQDAAAKGKKHKTPTQKGTFNGAIFKLSQATAGAGKGLVTLAIVENAFSGAPSYATCKAHKSADATVAKASTKTLQLLHASAKGKFTTKGRYSAATVLGTKWTVADRCDGTLTHDITDSVSVTDFVHHKTIVLHAGQSYLAKPPKHR